MTTSLHDYFLRYIEERGIPMPHYVTGSKIIEEAYELQQAVLDKDRDAMMDESADVVITALAVANQFGFKLEDALDRKIAKDKGRGEKKNDTAVY